MNQMSTLLLVLAIQMLVTWGQEFEYNASDQIFHTFVQGVYSRKAPVCLKPNRKYTLPRIEPGEIGDVHLLDLRKGRSHRRLTLAANPPLFEIPGFLNDTECDHIVNQARRKGFMSSEIFTDEDYEENITDLKNITRVSQTAWLKYDHDVILESIKERAIKLTSMPRDLVDETEPLQVVHYRVGGHYHAHFDSSEDVQNTSKPCCHITHLQQSPDNCRLCRYITILLYLNDVEEGGETAFLEADVEEYDFMNGIQNLSYFCYKASLVVRPKKGTAVLWYNNEKDPVTGWLGMTDPRSIHGGCDIVRGEKWLANMWLDVPSFDIKDESSVYTTKWN